MYKPCSCCYVYGHYTHDFPPLPQMRQMWEATAISHAMLCIHLPLGGVVVAVAGVEKEREAEVLIPEEQEH